MTKTRVKVSFRFGSKFYQIGSEVNADDPIVAKYPSMFTDAARTTATTPPPVNPPRTTPAPADDPTPTRPASGATKAQWSAYVTELGGTVGDQTKAELIDMAGELEG